jgi:protein-S-isoprenylcysteine O-methyltransferase Ste14
MARIATWICWGVVNVTWITGAVGGARTPRGQHRRTLSEALWQLAPVVVAILLVRLASHDLRRATDHSWWIELPGLVLLVASTCFTIWARISLGRMWSSSPDIVRTDHELRTDGPYAITRHPIYTGLFGMLVGTVLLNGLGASLGFLIVGVAFLAPRIPIEARAMSRAWWRGTVALFQFWRSRESEGAGRRMFAALRGRNK